MPIFESKSETSKDGKIISLLEDLQKNIANLSIVEETLLKRLEKVTLTTANVTEGLKAGKDIQPGLSIVSQKIVELINTVDSMSSRIQASIENIEL